MFSLRSQDLTVTFPDSDLFQPSIHVKSPGSINPMLMKTMQGTTQSHSHLVLSGTQLGLSEPIPIAAVGHETATL
jgi:uncharacterized ParB-like nuclease family protein